MIIITAEALLLLLIGLPLIIVAVWKKKKNKGNVLNRRLKIASSRVQGDMHELWIQL